jgi:stage II sporulation protein D
MLRVLRVLRGFINKDKKQMIEFQQEPVIKVGILSNVESVRFELIGKFMTSTGDVLESGEYTANRTDGIVSARGIARLNATSMLLTPVDFDSCKFIIHEVVIGINFHWERKETQTFQGSLLILRENDSFTVINELPVESYLISVISSEMSASCPPELLRAHAIVSRSWLLAQLVNAKKVAASPGDAQLTTQLIQKQYADGVEEIIKWYDHQNHANFDVCADDHCQRYQGISKAFSPEAYSAIQETRATVLVFNNEICDARYSKSCGGMSEVYRAAWEDKEVEYLSAVYDWQGEKENFAMPLTDETNAEAWINSSPRAYCNTESKDLLARILPGFDQETLDFYRWRLAYSQEEIQELLLNRVGLEVGAIISLEAAERGESGRIIKLKITGTKRTVVIGKELEIRRALSSSHLYSSAFVVSAVQGADAEYPEAFEFNGAGWGHGVGLCQIGAAVMADSGVNHEEILAHYFTGANLRSIY